MHFKIFYIFINDWQKLTLTIICYFYVPKVNDGCPTVQMLALIQCQILVHQNLTNCQCSMPARVYTVFKVLILPECYNQSTFCVGIKFIKFRNIWFNIKKVMSKMCNIIFVFLLNV